MPPIIAMADDLIRFVTLEALTVGVDIVMVWAFVILPLLLILRRRWL